MGEQTFITVPNEKQYQSSVTYLILNSLSFFRCVDSYTTYSPLIKSSASYYSRFTSLAFFAVIPLKVKSQTFSNESTHCRACFNNNTTILKIFYSETMINDREVSSGRTSYVFSSALVFISIKHVFLTFSLRARLIRTPR